jgi:hypothetical protein
MNKPILVVMAAGMGSRYGGLKQMDPVGANGEVILDYSVFDARRAGFETVVFIIKHEIEADFKAKIGSRIEPYMNVRYAYQSLDDLPEGYAVPEGRVKPWGTSQAILAARDIIDAPFAVINADDYYGVECFNKLYAYLTQPHKAGEYCMVGYLLKNTVTDNGSVARGVCEADANGKLITINERTRIEKFPGGIHFTEDDGASWTDLGEDTLVSMNMWGFQPELVAELGKRFPAFLDNALQTNPMKGEYLLPNVVRDLLAEGNATVDVLSTPDKWYGVTYHEDKAGVVAAMSQKAADGIYPTPLWK